MYLMKYRIPKKYFLYLPRHMMYWLVKNNFTFIMALFYMIFIIKRKRSKIKSITKDAERITILALNPQNFRGDLECLAEVGKFRVLTFANMWQTSLLKAFTNRKIRLLEYINAKEGSDIYDKKRKIDIFFDEFISALLKLIKIDCVITVNYRYVEDFFWVKHFEKKGIPNICLFRDGVLYLDRFYDGVVAFHRRYKGYPVSHVIVINQMCANVFWKSGFVTEAQVSVCGALRMDNLLRMINVSNNTPPPIKKNEVRRKRVILFYFPSTFYLFGQEELSINSKLSDNAHKYNYVLGIWPKRMDLFRDLHTSFIRLAMKYPEVDFVIKPKREDMKEVVNNNFGFDLSRIKNYTIEPDADVHDLIINSDVVIALQSTTVVEAAIAGKTVIFPLFYDYMKTKNYNDFLWRNHLDLFDVAENADELKSLVVERLRNPEIDEIIMEGRRKLFKECFSDNEGVALKKYVETIGNVVNSAKSRN